MIIIPVKEGEQIDRALKRFKRSLIKWELYVKFVVEKILLKNLLEGVKSFLRLSILSLF